MYTSSITVDQVIDALSAFLAPFAPGAAIVRGQGNRVAMPPSPCIVLTELLDVDLHIPWMDFDPTNAAANIKGAERIDVQIDFYGPDSGDFCKTAKAAFRSIWGFDHFPADIKPLYTSDGVQAPLTTGEQQYESRWTLTASMQYNPSVTVPQQFANVLTPTVELPVDL